MPRPAPSTVPVSSPITKLPPCPLSSKRSYPSPIGPLLNAFVVTIARPEGRASTVSLQLTSRFVVFTTRVFVFEERLERRAHAAHETNDTARLHAHVRSHTLCGRVHTVDGRANRV